MIRVYNTMALGVALTGIVSWLTYQIAGGDAIRVAGGRLAGLTAFGQTLFSPMVTIVLFLATLGLVFFMSFRIQTLSVGNGHGRCSTYTPACWAWCWPRSSWSTPAQSITRVFFITAASFGALSLYGYTTQRDLGPMGSFLIMGLIGLILASIVNIFLASSAHGVRDLGRRRAGLRGPDRLRHPAIKEMYDVNDDGTVAGRKAIMGALTLYLDFINMFLMLLRLFGDRR